MTVLVFLLVLLSASLHVFWNALAKKADNKASFAWLATVVAATMLAPVFVLLRLAGAEPLGAQTIALAGLSGLFEAAYTVLLVEAYRKADLSVAYPLSRGVAPIGTLAAGHLLVGDAVGPAGIAAVLVVVAGVAAVSFSARGPGRLHRAMGVLFAVAAGAMIAAYHLVDRRAVAGAGPLAVVEYLFFMHVSMAAGVTAWVTARRGLRAHALTEWRTNRRSVVVAGVLNFASYVLIVLALSRASGNVTYVAAGRNVGIVLSAVAGAVLLRERIGRLRAVGAGLITLGVVGLVLLAGRP